MLAALNVLITQPWTVHVGRHMQFKVWQPVFNKSCWLKTYDSTWLPPVSFPLVFHLLLLLSKCLSPNWLDQIADTRNTTSLFIFSSPYAVLHHRNQRLSCACSYSPSLHVPRFRPVPFRILDRSSVPFRSAPFREIVTTTIFRTLL